MLAGLLNRLGNAMGVAATLVVATGCITPATADDGSYYVTGTDIGIYPRAAPSMDSERVGSALDNGSTINIQCETAGQLVDNGYAPSDVWAQLPDGTFLPNAFIYTGADGWTPGVPRCADVAASNAGEAEMPKEYDGRWISNDQVPTQLLNHYFDVTGEPVVIDWSFFSWDAQLREAMISLEDPEGYEIYESNPTDDGDIYYALGAFTISRTSANCFAIRDTYDFDPNKVANIPFVFNWLDAQLGLATTFEVQSSGCL